MVVYGGQSPKCAKCSKTVYANEAMKSGVKEFTYHKACYKCSECSTKLTHNNCCPVEGVLYCTDHYMQRVVPNSYVYVQSGNAVNHIEADDI